MGQFSRKSEFSRKDIISDLPQSITETILTKLPIRDAVRTSILSSKWRNKWTTLTQLVFDDEHKGLPIDTKRNEKKLVNFIMRFLLLHDGPIHKFAISSRYLKMSPDIDQWLLFLSRKNIKELVLEMCSYEALSRAPSRIYSFQKLTSLVLCGFELKPPPGFKGFPCLKNLVLTYDSVNEVIANPEIEVIENLISSCPLLESFEFSNFDNIALNVRAPKLKYLTLDGYFIDAYLCTPHLVALNAAFYYEEVFKGTGEFPITYDYLRFINVKGISLAEMGEKLYFLRLLLKSPNLIQISVMGQINFSDEDTNLEFWEKECPSDFTFKQLKTLKISHVYGIPQEMEFLKFVLGRSPLLEVMSISPAKKVEHRLEMDMVIELLQFRRASAKAEIKFIQAKK